MRHEELTSPPMQTPDERAEEAREMGILRENEQRNQRIVDEYLSRHPEAIGRPFGVLLAEVEAEEAAYRLADYLDDHRAAEGFSGGFSGGAAA